MKPDSWLFGRDAARLSVLMVTLSFSETLGAETRTPMREALSSQLPKFDPNAGTPKPVVSDSKVKNRATLVRLPAAALTPPPKVEPPTNSEPPKDPVVVMPQVTVTGKSKPEAETDSPLPRLSVRTPVENLPAVPFESESARQERLVRKHLTAFDRLFLNRFTLPIFGVSQVARAEQLEREEATALAYNSVAEGIEWGFWTGKTPDEKKKLKAMYYDILVSRPK